MTARTIAAADLPEHMGQEVGVSDWIEVSQALIDQFADATRDHQFIHVDRERAGQTPFGGTIAHGFLVVSLLSRMAYDALPEIESTGMSVNYGMNRLRFPAPVKAGERVRARFVLRGAVERDRHQLLLTWDAMVEIDGGSKPALVAEWLTLTFLHAPSA